MKNPKIIEVVQPAASYYLPSYYINNDGIQDGEPQILLFCKGNKADDTVFRQLGVFSESLLMAVKMYLETVNTGDLKTHETSTAIDKIEEALMWLGKRAEDRKLRDVQGTYNK